MYIRVFYNSACGYVDNFSQNPHNRPVNKTEKRLEREEGQEHPLGTTPLTPHFLLAFPARLPYIHCMFTVRSYPQAARWDTQNAASL